MIIGTEGLVLRSTRYSDSSLVVRVFTEKCGCLSFMLKGVRSGRANKAAMYSPGQILDLQIQKRENRGLQSVKEARYAILPQQITGNIVRSSIMMFMLEVLNKCLKEEHEQPELFAFLRQEWQLLDALPEPELRWFPQLFLLRMSQYLGFMPSAGEEYLPYFDLQEGDFRRQQPLHEHLSGSTNQVLFQLLQDEEPLGISKTERMHLLNALLKYYQLHMDGFGKLQSPAILESIF